MAVENEQESPAPLTVRQKAEQDLAVVKERRHDLERRLSELRHEETFLTHFLDRLKRYDPDGAETEVATSSAANDRRVYHQGSYVLDAQQPARSALAALRRNQALLLGLRPKHPIAGSADAGHDGVNAAQAETHKPMPSPTSRRGQVAAYAMAILDQNGPATTKGLTDLMRADPDLYAFLGTKQEATLSSYLSRDPRFLFDQEDRVWTLVSNRQKGRTDQDGRGQDGASEEGSVS